VCVCVCVTSHPDNHCVAPTCLRENPWRDVTDTECNHNIVAIS